MSTAVDAGEATTISQTDSSNTINMVRTLHSKTPLQSENPIHPKAMVMVQDTTVRKSLNTIQATAEDGGLTRPAHPQMVKPVEVKRTSTPKAKRIVPASGKNVVVYHDPDVSLIDQTEETTNGSLVGSTGACTCHKKLKTADEEALELMGQDEIPEKYWEQLAEERRTALDESLRENEQLHEELQQLREENSQLSQMASQADYFASMLQMLTQDEIELDEEEAEKHEERTEADGGQQSHDELESKDSQLPNLKDDEDKVQTGGEPAKDAENSLDKEESTKAEAAATTTTAPAVTGQQDEESNKQT